MSEPLGVLLMAYGGPNTLDEVAPFLAEIRHGRSIPPAFVEEIRERYRAIGGGSPLLPRTRSQAEALAARLEAEGLPVPVEVGMRHWDPRVTDGLDRLGRQGVKRVIAIPMASHYSRMSTEVYASLAARGCEERDMSLTCVRGWHLAPSLIAAFAAVIRETLDLWTATDDPPFVLFTAHSLPSKILEEGDPYPRLVRETADRIAATLSLPRWEVAFQSQGRTGEPWLGPTVEESLERLAATGIRRCLLAPIGFLCDHVEILYDVDILFHAAARRLGILLRRIPSLNSHPLLIEALAGLVKDAARTLSGGAGR